MFHSSIDREVVQLRSRKMGQPMGETENLRAKVQPLRGKGDYFVRCPSRIHSSHRSTLVAHHTLDLVAMPHPSLLVVGLLALALSIRCSEAQLDAIQVPVNAIANYTLAVDSSLGYENSWGGSDGSECYGNLVTGLSAVSSFGYYVVLAGSNGGPPAAYGLIQSSNTTSIGGTVATSALVVGLSIASDLGQSATNATLVTATFSGPVTLDPTQIYALSFCSNITYGDAYNWAFTSATTANAAVYCNWPACTPGQTWGYPGTPYAMQVRFASASPSPSPSPSASPSVSGASPLRDSYIVSILRRFSA